jgi:structural maintenance of chromosome 1
MRIDRGDTDDQSGAAAHAKRWNPVVTKDGSVVEPGGILTGGSVREDVSFASYDTQALEQSIVKIEQDLAVLGDQIEKHATEIQRAEEQRLSLEPQREHYLERKREVDEKIKFLNADLRKTAHQIGATKTRVEEAVRVLQAREAAVEGMDLRQAAIDRAVFADFCARAGVGDIRQFEVTRLQTFEERYARRLQLQSKLAQLDNFIATEERTDPTNLERKLQDDFARLQSEYEQALEDRVGLDKRYEELTQQLKEVKEEKQRWQAADESNQLELRQRRRDLQNQKVELEQTDDSQAAANHERDTALQNVQSILQQTRVSNVQLPLLQEREAMGEATPSTFTQEEIDRKELDAVDFRKLSAAKKAKPDQRTFEAAVREYEDQLRNCART